MVSGEKTVLEPTKICSSCHAVFDSDFELLAHRLAQCKTKHQVSLVKISSKSLKTEGEKSVASTSNVNRLNEAAVKEAIAHCHLKCRYCGNKFTKRSNVRRHQLQSCTALPTDLKCRQRAVQKQKNMYSFHCAPCRLGFPSKSDLHQHQSKCTKFVSKKCAHCGRLFNKLFNLKRHERICRSKTDDNYLY